MEPRLSLLQLQIHPQSSQLGPQDSAENAHNAHNADSAASSGRGAQGGTSAAAVAMTAGGAAMPVCTDVTRHQHSSEQQQQWAMERVVAEEPEAEVGAAAPVRLPQRVASVRGAGAAAAVGAAGSLQRPQPPSSQGRATGHLLLLGQRQQQAQPRQVDVQQEKQLVVVKEEEGEDEGPRLSSAAGAIAKPAASSSPLSLPPVSAAAAAASAAAATRVPAREPLHSSSRQPQTLQSPAAQAQAAAAPGTLASDTPAFSASVSAAPPTASSRGPLFPPKSEDKSGQSSPPWGPGFKDRAEQGGPLGFLRCVREGMEEQVRGFFLPQGYPHTVTADYANFTRWRMAQSVASEINHVLTTQAMLYAVGLGKGAIPTAAALNWALKDGLGYATKMAFSKLGRRFDVNPKPWRLAADAMENASVALELLTATLPQHFVVLASTAGAGFASSSLVQSATRNRFFAGFAVNKNFAEITAKGEAQGMASKMVGLGLGIALAHRVGPRGPKLWLTHAALVATHMLCNAQSYRAVHLRSLNPFRAAYALERYRSSGQVPTLEEVNGAEPIMRLPLGLIHTFSSKVGMLQQQLLLLRQSSTSVPSSSSERGHHDVPTAGTPTAGAAEKSQEGPNAISKALLETSRTELAARGQKGQPHTIPLLARVQGRWGAGQWVRDVAERAALRLCEAVAAAARAAAGGGAEPEVQEAVELADAVRFGVPLSAVADSAAELDALAGLYQRERYLLRWRPRGMGAHHGRQEGNDFEVVLLEGATPQDMLRAMVQSVHLRHLLRARSEGRLAQVMDVADASCRIAAECRPGGVLRASYNRMAAQAEAMQEVMGNRGWLWGEGLLAEVGEWRLDRSCPLLAN